MNVSLTPALETWIHERVNTGQYTSASEVVREAVRLLQRAEEVSLAELRTLIREGLDDVQAGRVSPMDELQFSEMRERVQARRVRRPA